MISHNNIFLLRFQNYIVKADQSGPTVSNLEKETTREVSNKKCDRAWHIAFSSSELTLNNGAHPGRKDQRGSSASRPDKKRNRKTKNGAGTYSHTISCEELEKYFGGSQEDVVQILGNNLSLVILFLFSSNYLYKESGVIFLEAKYGFLLFILTHM